MALEPPERRERIERAIANRIRRASTAAVVLGIGNSGLSGIRNLYVEMLAQASSDIEVMDSLRQENDIVRWLASDAYDLPDEILPWKDGALRKSDKGWEFSFEWDALQPQRIRLIRPRLFIRAENDARIEFTATVFADSFAEPVLLKSTLNLVVRPKECMLKDLVPDLDALRRDASDRAAVSVLAARK